MKWDNIPRLARSFFKTPPPVVVFRSICRTVSSQSFPQSHCFYFLFSLNCGWGALLQLHPLIQHIWTSIQSSFYLWDQLHLIRTHVQLPLQQHIQVHCFEHFPGMHRIFMWTIVTIKFKHLLAGGWGFNCANTLPAQALLLSTHFPSLPGKLYQPWFWKLWSENTEQCW